MELHAQIACAMPRELAKKGLAWQDRAVYTEAIYYGRENLTDGKIERTTLAFWMPDMPVKERTRRLDAMRDLGALLDHPEGWQFPEHVWRKWGKMRAEVEVHREAEAQRKADYRNRRRNESGDVPSLSQRDTTSPRRNRADSRKQPYPKPYPEPEPEPYPEPYPEPITGTSSSVSQRAHPPTDDDVAKAALQTLAGSWAEQHAQPPKRRAYIARVLANADDHLPELRRLASEHPNTTPASLAKAYTAGGWPQAIDPGRADHPATCECDGTGWIAEVDSRTSARCWVTEWPDAIVLDIRRGA